MDSFESKDAAEWLSISPKNDDPQSSAHEPSSSHSSRNQLRFRTHNPTIGNAEVFRTMPASSPGPALHQSRIKRDVLIDLDPLEEQPKPKAPFACSNPFASLASEGSTSSAESTPIRDRHGTNSPVVLRTPVHTVPLGKQEVSGGNIANETLIQKGHSRASSSHFDGLTGLDPSFFVPSSAGLHPSSSESVMTEGPPGQTLISLLDEDVPPLKRQEDEAWFKAQSGKGTAPSVSQPPSGDTSRSHFEQLGQLIYPIGTPATPSYRDRTSPPDRGSPRGGPRNRGGPRSRGGQRVRGGRHGSHSHAPQRSTYSYSGSEDTSGTVFKQPRGQASTRGQGYSPRGSRGPRGRGSYAQSHSRPAGQNAPFVRDSMRENSHASSDQSEEISLAARVADAIESGEKSYSLAVYHDNAATTRWRKTKMLSGKTISLPKNLNLVGKNFDTKSSSKPAIARPAEIAMITNTHIDQVWGDKKTAQLVIYGSAEAVTEADKLITEWLREIKSDHGDALWAKVWGFDKKAARKLRKRLLRDTARRKYRQTIVEGEVLTHSAQFIWPLPKEPEQVLGVNFEALDPIRMNCECYITCERGSRTIFRIQGNDEEKVGEALERLQCLPAEWYAKMFEAESFVILDISCAVDPDDLPPIIKVPYHLPRPLAAPTASTNDAVTFRFKYPLQPHQVTQAPTEDSPAGKLLAAVVETTRHARYFRNSLKLHLHLGTFAARKTQQPDLGENTAYSFPAFADMMEEHDAMDSKVSMEIGDSIVERHVLTRCFEASHILAPQDAWTFNLSDVKPVYCATFEIANPAGQAGDLILEIELAADSSGTSIVSKSWFQLAKGKTEPRKLLDGSILSLQNGGLSWHLEMDEFMAVDERGLSPDYQLFPNTLRLDIAAADDLSSGHNFVIYRSRPDRILKVPIKSVRQKRCWRFNTLGSRGEWVVEVAHVGKTTIGTDGQQTPFQPRWTFNVSNNNWDRLLASNSRADIGQVAKWGPGNPANLLFPMNPDNSALLGVARQDDDASSEESDGEYDNKPDIASPEESGDGLDEPPSLQNFEQLLDLLRTLTDVAIGKPPPTSPNDRANESTKEA